MRHLTRDCAVIYITNTFYDSSMDLARPFCCHKMVSITYRGSTYEKSWETRLYTPVAGVLYGDTCWLRQSAATPDRYAAATS
jgi:hypothetical protein